MVKRVYYTRIGFMMGNDCVCRCRAACASRDGLFDRWSGQGGDKWAPGWAGKHFLSHSWRSWGSIRHWLQRRRQRLLRLHMSLHVCINWSLDDKGIRVTVQGLCRQRWRYIYGQGWQSPSVVIQRLRVSVQFATYTNDLLTHAVEYYLRYANTIIIQRLRSNSCVI